MSNANSATPTIVEKDNSPKSSMVNNPSPPIKDEKSGIDVQQSEAEYEHLRRTLTAASAKREHKDAEAQGDDFDLTEYLQGNAQAMSDAGFKKKFVGVTWTDLGVKGSNGINMNIRTFVNSLMEMVLMPVIMVLGWFNISLFNFGEKDILQGFNGVAQPGQMVLVLGRPGSGCSTFLKTISNQRGGFKAITGEVKYAGLTAEEFGKYYSGVTAYNMEDDVHFPTLTVAQTLDFALRSKTPGRRLPEQTKRIFRQEVANSILKMLNISHTKDTLVGNEYVRGVSGGERKRVSIAETYATGSSVSSWDNSSRGLDASTAFDYVKSLRITTDIFHLVSFVSLYQAGEGLYDQFDKVLLIDSGREIYYGPIHEARAYFVSLGFKDLPRQTTADYLTGLTDAHERQYQDGRDATNVPSTPEELEAAFRKSQFFADVVEERARYLDHIQSSPAIQEDFRAAVKDSQRKGVSRKSPFTVSYFTQIASLIRRQTQMTLQNKFDIYTSFGTTILIAVVVGTLFLNLPQTSAGAFTRGGILFITLLFNGLTAFSELPAQMMGRPVLYKQTSFKFYRPSALALANIISDIPIAIVRIFIFCIITYFLTGLQRSAGAFFIFYLFTWLVFITMTVFFRLIGTVTVSYDTAARLATVIISLMVQYSGYLIQFDNMKRWLFWIHYLNPIAYGFEALMVNEFSRLSLLCVGASVVPNSYSGSLSGYSDSLGSNSVCTLPGAVAGEQYVNGSAYVITAFQYQPSNLWRNFGILCTFFLGFLALQCYAAENFNHGANVLSISITQKENPARKKLNDALKANRLSGKESTQDLQVKSKKPYTWEKLCYTVPTAAGPRQLLDNVYGYVKPGTLTALMGASGAGKTTLLDVLAGRKTIGVITGDMLIAGKPTDVAFQASTAYAEQMDTHEMTSTVREALRFSAYLRQPAEVSKEEKDAYVEEVIALLELDDFADAMIGVNGYGLSVEGRKRVTIGVELAARPQLLLFLDEPTSGLDGQSAYNIVRFLRKLAQAGQCVLCTIHQPNALLFENFDRLLLLQKGGQTVYFGDIGKDSHVLRDYLAANGAICPAEANPAEYMLDAVGAGSKRMVGDKNWADIWKDSAEFKKVNEEIQELKAFGLSLPEDNVVVRQYASSFKTQLLTVFKRTMAAGWRNGDYMLTRLFAHFIFALFTALTFLNLDNSVISLQYKVFVLFFVTVLPALILAQCEPMFIFARMTAQREYSSKMYSPTVFALSQLMAEIPNSIVCAVVFFLLLYYPVGFQTDSARAGYAFAMILITEIFSVTLAQAVGALSPDFKIAAICNAPLVIIFSMFSGVTQPFSTLVSGYHWLYYLDPFTWLIGGLIGNQLGGVEVICRPNEFAVFQPPSGQTCGDYAMSFAEKAGGYINNMASSSDCQYCQYRSGDVFANSVNVFYEDRARDIGIFLCYVVSNIIITIVASRYLKYNKR